VVAVELLGRGVRSRRRVVDEAAHAPVADDRDGPLVVDAEGDTVGMDRTVRGRGAVPGVGAKHVTHVGEQVSAGREITRSGRLEGGP
jgi:hypothetical protein